MSLKRKKREYLDRTDHLLDMSPTGRNLFVSRDKQAQHRAARRLKVWMRVVIVLVILAVTAAAGLVAAFSLVPWFRSELTAESSSGDNVVSARPSPAVQEYDSMGLPIYEDEICLFTVSPARPADREFAPPLATENGVQVDVHVADALRLMTSAMKNDGFALIFTEGYVSYGEQEKRFEAKVKELVEKEGLTTVMARTEAKSREPAPGESDFQSGLCLRISADPATFSSSRTYSWLKANMGKYGFVFRWPEYKEDYTKMAADLTVIRYVGGAHAAAMQQRSMCLEEYLDYLSAQ